MRCFFRPIAGNDRIVDPTLFTGILSRDLAGRINWGKTRKGAEGAESRNKDDGAIR
jgi:hypothetical protein